jgi:hypothetical protein
MTMAIGRIMSNIQTGSDVRDGHQDAHPVEKTDEDIGRECTDKDLNQLRKVD